eukprot:COSAG05_NODE_2066_length_3619_cov_2.043466_2_plen_71_part_00
MARLPTLEQAKKAKKAKKIDPSYVPGYLKGTVSSQTKKLMPVAIHVGGLEGPDLEDEAKLIKLFSRCGST